MADATLNTSIAEYQALQITLWDDLVRFNTLLSGDYLTTAISYSLRWDIAHSVPRVCTTVFCKSHYGCSKCCN